MITFHKDINPADILANSVTGQCWLTGFGIASRSILDVVPGARRGSTPVVQHSCGFYQTSLYAMA
jgi:hypothetical protein